MLANQTDCHRPGRQTGRAARASSPLAVESLRRITPTLKSLNAAHYPASRDYLQWNLNYPVILLSGHSKLGAGSAFHSQRDVGCGMPGHDVGPGAFVREDLGARSTPCACFIATPTQTLVAVAAYH